MRAKYCTVLQKSSHKRQIDNFCEHFFFFNSGTLSPDFGHVPKDETNVDSTNVIPPGKSCENETIVSTKHHKPRSEINGLADGLTD